MCKQQIASQLMYTNTNTRIAHSIADFRLSVWFMETSFRGMIREASEPASQPAIQSASINSRRIIIEFYENVAWKHDLYWKWTT